MVHEGTLINPSSSKQELPSLTNRPDKNKRRINKMEQCNCVEITKENVKLKEKINSILQIAESNFKDVQYSTDVANRLNYALDLIIRECKDGTM